MKIFKSLKGTIKTILFLIILVSISAFVIQLFSKDIPKADTKFMTTLLTESSELTTSKLQITGITDYSDTGVKLLNRSDFTMVYTAIIRAGVELDKVKVKADDLAKIIHITVPKAIIQDAKVAPESIKYYGEKFSLFNMNEKEDANKAQKLAEEDAKEEAVSTGILELADSQAQTLIKGILSPAIPEGYKLKFK